MNEWRKRLRAAGFSDPDSVGIIEREHAELARDRERVAPKRLRLVNVKAATNAAVGAETRAA